MSFFGGLVFLWFAANGNGVYVSHEITRRRIGVDLSAHRKVEKQTKKQKQKNRFQKTETSKTTTATTTQQQSPGPPSVDRSLLRCTFPLGFLLNRPTRRCAWSNC